MSSFLGPRRRYSRRKAIELGAHCLACAAFRDELEDESALCDVHLAEWHDRHDVDPAERAEAMWERETER